MRKGILGLLFAVVIGSSAMPAGAAPLSASATLAALPSANGDLIQYVQLREERRERQQARREVRRERRDVRRADTVRERRMERRELRAARRDLRRERRDVREARRDRRYYVRGGRRYYRHPVTGAEIFAGIVGSIVTGAIAASQNADVIAYCESRYRSYDPRTGTYLGYDGQRHPCP